ncbi:hypothetical protein K437DRAFT_154048 [Tilletiaria anomala UBC 951]|uniref:Zn(2)-C6 fungal-type domain-containing protein n=1 Tax=Tilletiaria anomala (strain ATCC 24038 / CBS 436.72 / UBC 951) TaxID=1037660 RepID=A0A066VP08_TILAU|nr:uncharacterized protein K437DRAFT_154048 [Tilletiaria anomala UBC 951]KDN43201.1 hypothetical protein K437DRAFT_154048 [Tilletiaria anomala UBC 951]
MAYRNEEDIALAATLKGASTRNGSGNGLPRPVHHLQQQYQQQQDAQALYHQHSTASHSTTVSAHAYVTPSASPEQQHIALGKRHRSDDRGWSRHTSDAGGSAGDPAPRGEGEQQQQSYKFPASAIFRRCSPVNSAPSTGAGRYWHNGSAIAAQQSVLLPHSTTTASGQMGATGGMSYESEDESGASEEEEELSLQQRQQQKKQSRSHEQQQQRSASARTNPSSGSGNATNKVQKACVNCRRAKTRCVNVDSKPPCERCKVMKQLCKFRLRSDDENWRDKTDVMLGRLTDAVEGLLSQQQGTGMVVGMAPSHTIPGVHLGHAAQAPIGHQAGMYWPHHPQNAAGHSFQDSGSHDPGRSAGAYHLAAMGYPSSASPHALNFSVAAEEAPLPPYTHLSQIGPITTLSSALGIHAANHRVVSLSQEINHTGAVPPPGAASGAASLPAAMPLRQPPIVGAGIMATQLPGASSNHSGTAPPVAGGAGEMGAPPASDGLSHGKTNSAGGASSDGLSHHDGISAVESKVLERSSGSASIAVPINVRPVMHLHQRSDSAPSKQNASAGAGAGADTIAHRPSSASATSASASAAGAAAHEPRVFIEPSYTLAQVLKSETPERVSSLTSTRWIIGGKAWENYARPAEHVGRDDPRLNAVSMGLVPLERARQLFIFFANHHFPHCFGFPTFPASENMTPVIIASILGVASLHNSSAAKYFEGLKAYMISAVKPEEAASLAVDQELDPEMGIGVEEITGACVFASWIGGELGWQMSRVARWWTLAYLRLFSRRNEATLGEALSILPPFRNIDEADRLRVWLMAYVSEAHSCLINERKGLLEREDAKEYMSELRRALMREREGGDRLDETRTKAESVAEGKVFEYELPPADRQLLAHTELAHILTRAQDLCMDLRSRIASGEPRVHAASRLEGWIASADMLVAEWDGWFHDLERWRLEAGLLDDLSSSSAIAADVTICFHLSRAFLGSLALEYTISPHLIGQSGAVGASKLETAQSKLLTDAKMSALVACDLLLDDIVAWTSRLAYLPAFYHFMIGHAGGLLLLLVQRKWRFLLASESRKIVTVVERLVHAYSYQISIHSAAQSSEYVAAQHPAEENVTALSRALLAIKTRSSNCRQ